MLFQTCLIDGWVDNVTKNEARVHRRGKRLCGVTILNGQIASKNDKKLPCGELRWLVSARCIFFLIPCLVLWCFDLHYIYSAIGKYSDIFFTFCYYTALF